MVVIKDMQAIYKKSSFEYLGNSHFAMAFLFAAFLHIVAIVVWIIMPHPKVIDIPVYAINVRLGDESSSSFEVPDISDSEPATQQSKNLDEVESAIAKLVRVDNPEQEAEKPAKKIEKSKNGKPERSVEKATEKLSRGDSSGVSDNIMDSPFNDSSKNKTAGKSGSDTPRQFVRALPAQQAVSRGAGDELGNSGSSKAQIKARYEQAISLWIQKFKLYPKEARARMLQGSTVIRIRIDRRGNIRYRALEGSTGTEELDKAALDMIRRANPVPAVPDDYPEGDMFEFLIPVKFQI